MYVYFEFDRETHPFGGPPRPAGVTEPHASSAPSIVKKKQHGYLVGHAEVRTNERTNEKLGQHTSVWGRRGDAGCLKAVWLEIFGPVFHGLSAEIDPRDPTRLQGLAPAHQFARAISPTDQFQCNFGVANGTSRTEPPARLPPERPLAAACPAVCLVACPAAAPTGRWRG